LAENYTQIGLAKFGTPLVPPASNIFNCKGRCIVKVHQRLVMQGLVVYRLLSLICCNGSIWTGGTHFRFLQKGILAWGWAWKYTADAGDIIIGVHEKLSDVSNNWQNAYKLFIKGTLRQEYVNRFCSIGVLVFKQSVVLLLNGIIRQTDREKIKITGTIQQRKIQTMAMIGTIRQRCQKIFSLHGTISCSIKKCLQMRGKISLPVRKVFCMKGKIAANIKKHFSCYGDLANTWGKWQLLMTGTLKVAVFVQELPRILQDFVTNKRWFGDDGDYGG